MKLYTPFSTRLSGSAKETELRLRSIFQWKKQRPPAALLAAVLIFTLGCGGLVACRYGLEPGGESHDYVGELLHTLGRTEGTGPQAISPYSAGREGAMLVVARDDENLYLGLWSDLKQGYDSAYLFPGGEESFVPFEAGNGTGLLCTNQTTENGVECSSGLGYFLCRDGVLTRGEEVPPVVWEHSILPEVPGSETMLEENSSFWEKHKAEIDGTCGFTLYGLNPDWDREAEQPDPGRGQWTKLGYISFVDAQIELLLDEICSGSTENSDPGSCIAAHREDYDLLVKLNHAALTYCYREFMKGGQADLRAKVMERLCRTILTPHKEEPVPPETDSRYASPQQWFDAYLQETLDMEREQGADAMKAQYPARRLLLDLI